MKKKKKDKEKPETTNNKGSNEVATTSQDTEINVEHSVENTLKVETNLLESLNEVKEEIDKTAKAPNEGLSEEKCKEKTLKKVENNLQPTEFVESKNIKGTVLYCVP